MPNLLVLDLEATCFDQRPSPRNEVIEVGYVIVSQEDEDGPYIIASNPMSLIIKTRHSYVSPYCTELTGWTAKEIEDQGMRIEDAWLMLRDVWKHHGCDIWVSWGMYDYNMIKEESDRLGVGMPIPRPFHLNAKTMWAWLNKTTPTNLGSALEQEGLDFVGRPHLGRDDAYNLARLLVKQNAVLL